MSAGKTQRKTINSKRMNIALLKGLEQPISEALDNLVNKIQDLHADRIQLANFDGAEDAHLISRSLEMIEANLEHKVAESIEALTKKVQTNHIRDNQELYICTSLIKNACIALKNHIKEIIAGKNVSGVLLWSVLSPIQRQLGVAPELVKIENLYFPKPVFNSKEFLPIKKTELKEITNKLRQNFTQDSTAWANSEDKMTVKKSLQSLAKTTKQFYELKHRVGYQGYWLALMGRLQIALLQDDLEMDNKRPLGKILENASLEMQKFGEDNQKVAPESLKRVITPLVSKDVLKIAEYSSILKEVVERFDIDIFYEEAQNAMDSEKVKQKADFAESKKEIKDMIYELKKEWNRLTTSPVPQNKKTLNRILNSLSSKKYLFPSNAATRLLMGLLKLKNVYTEDFNESITEIINREVATTIIIFENIIEKDGEMSLELEKQVDIQLKRLQFAYEDNEEALNNLSHVEWDQDTKVDDYKNSLVKVAREIRKDIAVVEKALSEIFAGNPSPISNKDMEANLRMVLGALKIMKEEQAGKILVAVRNRIVDAIKKGEARTEDDEYNITLGLSSIMVFLDSSVKGDPDAILKLSEASQVLLGEEIQHESNFGENSAMSSSLDFIDSHESEEREENLNVIEEYESEHEMQETEFNKPENNELNNSDKKEIDEEREEEEAFPAYEESSLLAALNDNNTEFSDLNDKQQDPILEESQYNLSTEETLIEANPGVEYSEEKSSELPVFLKEKDYEIINVVDKSIDEELAEVFVEELDEIITNIQLFKAELNEDPTSIDLLKDLRRQYHTLKGSGRMAEYHAIGEVGWRIESHLNNVIDKDEFLWDNSLKNVIDASLSKIKVWKRELEQTKQASIDATDILEALYFDENKGKSLAEEAEDVKEEESESLMPEVTTLEGITLEVNSEEEEFDEKAYLRSIIGNQYNHNEENSEVVEEQHEEIVSEENSEVVEEQQEETASEENSEVVEEQHEEIVNEENSEVVEEQQEETASEENSEVVEEQHEETVNEENSEVVEEQHEKTVNEENSEVVEEQHEETVNEENSEVVEEQHEEKVSEENSEVVEEQHEEKVSEENSEVVEEQHEEKVSEENSEVVTEQHEVFIGVDFKFTQSDFDMLSNVVSEQIKELEISKANWDRQEKVNIDTSYVKSIHELNSIAQTISLLPVVQIATTIENKVYAGDTLQNTSKEILLEATDSMISMFKSFIEARRVPEERKDIEDKLLTLLTNEELNYIDNNVPEMNEEDKAWDEALDALSIISEQIIRFKSIIEKLSGKK